MFHEHGNKARFDAYAGSYDREIDHPLRHFVDARGEYFVRLKCEQIQHIVGEVGLEPASMTVVDVGCGVGSFEGILGGIFYRLVGFDISAEMLRVAAKSESSATKSFVCSDAHAIPLPTSCAQLVFTSCLFHHLPEASAVPILRECTRICAEGGYVVCFEHNPLNPLTQLVVRTTPLDRDARLIFPSDLASAFQEAGLNAVERRFILFAPEPIDRRLYRLGKWMYRMPFGGQYLVVGRKT
ncbi:MAG: hypothetical protein AUK03_16200 [Anaerolineae bacterium CG2_30_64_16]|nr:MAG: hypothetical protein AUK03_16200 [Anaerolineae bacterium CG2_30_64_16]